MTGVRKEICPACGGDCNLKVDFDTGMTAHLPDRIMALSPMVCWLTCVACGQTRDATISNLDINMNTGRLEFGTIEFT